MTNRIDPHQKLPGDPKTQTAQTEKAPASKEPIPQKADLFSKNNADNQARQMAKNQPDFGQKMRFQPGPRPGSSAPPKAHPSTFRPAPAIQPNHYQRLLKDPVFRQPSIRDSGLHRYVSQRSSSKGESRSSISLNYLQRLIRMRPQIEDRQNLRQILRYEIHAHRLREREKAKEVDGAKKEGTSPETKGEKKPGNSNWKTALDRNGDGKGRMPSPPSGKSARFLLKTGAYWINFVKNVVSLGSVEQIVTKHSKLIADSSLFRGLYKALADQKGLTLIADLKFTEGNRVLTEKFARILVENPSLLALLERMEPGDHLNRELLQQLGEELQYTKLAHAASGASKDPASAQEALNQLKSNYNPMILARFEQTLLDERHRRAESKRREGSFADESNSQDFGGGRPFYSGQGVNDRLKYFGKPKWWLFLGYSMGITILVLIIYGIIRNL